MRIPLLVLLFSLGSLAHPALAQSEAACIWMQISPSTTATGMGNTFSPLAGDPFSAWLAPGSEAARPLDAWAELELVAYPQHVEWLPPFSASRDDIYLNNQAIVLRGNVNEALRRAGLNWQSAQPWQFSLSYLHVLLNEGRQTITDESGTVLGEREVEEQAHSLRVGLGLRHEFWSLGVGLGLDQVISDLGQFPGQGQDTQVGRSTTFDGGLNLQLHSPHQVLDAEDPDSPFVHWTAGVQYSKLFLGKHISYQDSAEADPMPFHDRLGLALRWRLALPATGHSPELPVLEAHLATERLANLVASNPHTTIRGVADDQLGGHNSNPADPVDEFLANRHYLAFDERLLAGGSAEITRSWGWELGLLGTFSVRGGALRDRSGSIDERSQGLGLRSSGLFNWMLRSHPAGMRAFPTGLLQHLDLRYEVARLHSDSPRNGTVYREVGLRLTF